MKKQLSIAVGFLLSAGLLFLVLRQLDYKMVAQAYAHVKMWHVLVLALAVMADLAVRGLRWKLLVSPVVDAPAFTMIKLETIGLAMNNVLPLRLGELARTTIGAGVLKIPFVTLLSTIVVERALDTISLGVIFVLAARFASGLELVQRYGAAVWVLLGAMLAGLAALVFMDVLIERNTVVRGLAGRFPRLGGLARRIAVGAEALRKPRLAALILFLGFGLWAVNAFGYYWGAKAMGIEPAVGYGRAMLVLCTSAIAVSVPAMPGYFGTFELAIQRIMMAWGVDKDLSFAYAAFMHINIYIVMTLLGVIFLYQTGHSLGGVWKRLSGREADSQ
ncbi:MAG: lysylphosphatidylglycerol synthase transmembrane domain-containing protein [Elusimicrobiaceae bacterium]|nr:lysylphosphatidylglycerol synthase transmembrane domain-containing protein [Elusimicrobiaceae bacterium]